MAASGRRRRNGSLGQIPLSSGEIELYSRQDEAARRRRRLLAVREQERRLAQQVTQRYRDNLQKLQRSKSKRVHKQLTLEQQKLLTELHVRYQYSLQNMGTAHRNARFKMLELMEQAQQEKEKWTYNRQITGKQRTMEAEEAREQEEQLRTARRRQVQQNMERLRLLSGQQRQQASARARREQEVAMLRAKDKEEIERLKRMQSPEEVFIVPRPREKDVLSYQYTRAHCHATTSTEERPVTVIRHNRKHPTAMRGEEEAKKYSEEMDVKRERDRLIMEDQQQTATQRGENALESITSKQQGQQAMEWLALVDKMERHTRGRELGGGDDYSVDAGQVDRERNDPEQMAERAFARMLELDEESVELSVFSIATDDDQSVGLADTGQEKSDGDKVTNANADYKVKLKATEYPGSFDSVDGIKARKPGKNAQGEGTMGKSGPQEGGEVLLKPRVGRHVDNDKSAENSFADDGRQRGNMSTDRGHLQWDSHAKSAGSVAGDDDRGQRRYEEERPEGTDSEEEEFDHDSDRLRDDENSMQRLDNRSQEVRGFRLSKPQSRPVTAQNEFSDPSDSRGKAGDRSVLDVSSENGQSSLSLSRLSEHAVPSGSRHSSSGLDERFVADEEEFFRTGRYLDTRHSSDCASMERKEMHDDRPIPDRYTSEIYPGEEHATRSHDDRTGSEYAFESDIAGDRHLHGDSSAASSRAESRLGHDGDEREGDEAGHEERDSRVKRSRDQVVVALQSNENSVILDRTECDEVSSGLRDRDVERLPKQPVQLRDQDHLESSHYSDTQAFEVCLGHLSSSSILSDDEEVRDDKRSQEGKSSIVAQKDEDDRSVSESSFAPSQKSLSRLDEVVNARARALEQRFIDQHMLSFSSEEHSEDEEKVETGVRRSSGDSSDAHPPVNVSPYDPYRQQMDHRSRRTSAASVTQYSLPPSDSQSSFDDSFDQSRPGYGDDSFVNELVPMFPKRALPQQCLEEENQAEEEFDVQLVAPNMSRMLPAERRSSFNRSRQYPSQHQLPDHLRRESASDSSRSSSESSSSDVEAKSVDTSVEQARAQQTRAAPSTTTRSRRDSHADTVEHLDDNRSDISSESGVSSLGFAVQLNLVAGTTRRRNKGANRQEKFKRGDNQQREEDGRDDELDNESVASERSFASSSSMPMDARFNYLANMTSAVGKSLPLHLRIPAMIYGNKDMTKPPAPMDWSESSVSSFATASEDPDGRARPTRRISRSNSSSSGSPLEEQRAMDGSDANSDNDRSSETGEERAKRVTFDSIKKKVSALPPPPLGSLNMSRPPPPMQTSDRHFDESQSSSDQHSDNTPSSGRRHLPPPPVGSINMSQPPAMHNYRRSNQYGSEEERKHDDSSSDASFSSSVASSQRHSLKKAERIVIPAKKAKGDSNDSDGDDAGKEMSLAEAFQRRHPRFGQRVESHQDKLKRQREKQPEQKAETLEQKTTAKRDTAPDDLPPEKQELLNRLASGSRAKISNREMKERSRRLYHQLPEVVERKRQEEVMRRRRERLNELREQEKERRLQQKQRRQQQLQRR
ncbi:hypothetical protein L914_03835 [Phytophthora nicotianae]|uniref:Uncharacterized protein n=1 Tax=Phytophthora nicotianae TaxID=4792 RepID=W2NVQ6_PHYNI|nr:hypothetical protein L914_03835 [Phytophthora nicotianae]